MSFDSSRFTFNPWNDFFGTVMQQGRVQLDSDWNEWLAQVARRIQAGTLDTVGPAVYPFTTPNAFKLTVGTDGSGNASIVIGPGRMYVDGLLAENHGQPAPDLQEWVPPSGSSVTGLSWDGALEDLVGPSGVFYAHQPYYAGAAKFAPFPQTGGPFFVYLDVWKREVTFLEDPELVEKAVGVDTTGRLQTVWQVKWLDPKAQVNCSTKDSDIPAWASLLLPPGANLTTGVTQAGSPGPCCLTPTTGYTGLENQLYRLEIHQKGQPLAVGASPPITSIPPGTATFKWSRDNASVATGVTAITQGGTTLTVQSTGKDNVLCFSPNAWVEITDDWLELNGLPGELHQIATNGVDASSKIITLTTGVISANFPVDANGLTDPSRHTRIRRWDQAGKVYASDGVTVWTDLNAPGSTGDIPVPPPGNTLVLENGVTVSFGWDSSKAPLKTADFWNFAARAADGTVEYLDHAPPRGIYHHYCRLGVGNLQNGFQDCRNPWPPVSTGGVGCECAACVTADGHNQGTFTIQAAIDRVKGLGGGKVCLGPGNYNITQTINISGAKSLTIAGHGGPWLLWAPRTDSSAATGVGAAVGARAAAAVGTGPGAEILIDTSVGVTLEDFGLLIPSGTQTLTGTGGTMLNPGVMIQNSAFVTVQRCAFLSFTNKVAANPAVALGGFVTQIRIDENFISFSTTDAQGNATAGPGAGLAHLPTIVPTGTAANPLLVTLDLYVENNFIQTGSSGVYLDALSYHAWQVSVSDNFIGPSSAGGVVIAGMGIPAPEAVVEITGNEIVTTPTGHGIVCGVGATRISGNDILCLNPGTTLAAGTVAGDGILLDTPFLATTSPPLDRCQLVGNRISAVAGIGIEIRAQLASAIIQQNLIENTGAGGIIMTGSLAGVPSTAQHLSIARNQLLDLVPVVSNPLVTLIGSALGIRLLLTASVEIEGNVVKNLGLDTSGNLSRVGIGLLACDSVRISGNRLSNIGNPEATFNPSAGIAVAGPPIGRVEVSGNISRRNDTVTHTGSSTEWLALFIGPLADLLKAGNLQLVQTDSSSFVFLSDSFAVAVNAGLQTASVRGNFLDALTISPSVEIILTTVSGSGSCIFTENQCVLNGPRDLARTVVGLSAPAVIASNNVLRGGIEALRIETQPPKTAIATVLGNVLNGGAISLNGSPLGPPWAALNV